MVLGGASGIATELGAAPGAATAVLDFAVIALFVQRERRGL